MRARGAQNTQRSPEVAGPRDRQSGSAGEPELALLAQALLTLQALALLALQALLALALQASLALALLALGSRLAAIRRAAIWQLAFWPGALRQLGSPSMHSWHES